MTKIELANELKERCNIETKAKAKEIVDTFLDIVHDAVVCGDKVSFIGFGTFETVERAARPGRNPHTGASLEIPARRVPVFKAGRPFKEDCNA